jgi:hypothetical protein
MLIFQAASRSILMFHVIWRSTTSIPQGWDGMEKELKPMRLVSKKGLTWGRRLFMSLQTAAEGSAVTCGQQHRGGASSFTFKLKIIDKKRVPLSNDSLRRQGRHGNLFAMEQQVRQRGKSTLEELFVVRLVKCYSVAWSLFFLQTVNIPCKSLLLPFIRRA